MGSRTNLDGANEVWVEDRGGVVEPDQVQDHGAAEGAREDRLHHEAVLNVVVADVELDRGDEIEVQGGKEAVPNRNEHLYRDTRACVRVQLGCNHARHTHGANKGLAGCE